FGRPAHRRRRQRGRRAGPAARRRRRRACDAHRRGARVRSTVSRLRRSVMALVFRELHKAKSPELLNEEWLLLENTGPAVGTPHEEKGEIKNYHLFLREPVLTTPGMVVRVSQKQQELAKAIYAPKSKDGIEKEE